MNTPVRLRLLFSVHAALLALLSTSSGCSAQRGTGGPVDEAARVFARVAPTTLNGVRIGMTLAQLREARERLFTLPYTGLAEALGSDTLLYYFRPAPLEDTNESLLGPPRYTDKSVLRGIRYVEWVTGSDSSATALWKQRLTELEGEFGRPQVCNVAPPNEVPTHTAEWEIDGLKLAVILHPSRNATPLADSPTFIPASVSILLGEDFRALYPILTVLKPTTCP